MRHYFSTEFLIAVVILMVVLAGTLVTTYIKKLNGPRSYVVEPTAPPV
jgi:hypothetical protein